MLAYIVRRLLLMIPTLIGIMVINFAIVQFAPGGPIEQIIAEITGTDAGTTSRISGGSGRETGTPGQRTAAGAGVTSKYREPCGSASSPTRRAWNVISPSAHELPPTSSRRTSCTTGFAAS